MKIVMLLDNPYSDDQRVIREAETLVKDGHEVKVYCLHEDDFLINETINGVVIKRIFDLQIFGIKNRRYLNKQAELIAETEFDVIHAHDFNMIRMAARIKKLKQNIRLIYDSHELFHEWEMNMAKSDWWLKLKSTIVRSVEVMFEKHNGKLVDEIITVNDSIAARLKKYFSFGKEILVLRNIPPRMIPLAKSNYLREHFKISADKKIIVFFGTNVFIKTINLEMALQQLCRRKDVAVVIFCKQNEHQQAVADFVENQKLQDVYFHPFIPFNKSNEILSGADVGLVPSWNKSKMSYWLGFDSKFMDYMMAEIPVLATCQPEYEKMVNQYQLGICVNPDKENAFSKGFEQLINNYNYYKEANKKARESLNWENESKKLTDFYRNLHSVNLK